MIGPKIKGVEAHLVDTGQNFVVVRILTDADGLYGLGDATLNGREPAVAAYIKESLSPLIAGKEVRDHSALWELIYRAAYWVPGGVGMSALAGIDMALWDLRGKIAEQPVWQLLGGRFRESVDTYTHIAGESGDDIIEKAMDAVAGGARAMRIQAAIGDPEEFSSYGTTGSTMAREPIWEVWDAERYLQRVPEILSNVRRELGPEIRLLHDSHGRLTLQEARAFCAGTEEVQLFFWEDPFRPETAYNHLSQLRNSGVRHPIAFGELLNRYDQVQPYLEKELIDYLRVDLSHIGGVTAAVRMAHMAQLRDIKVAWHGPPDLSPIGHVANIHVDMAVHNFGIQEWAPVQNPAAQEVFGPIPTVRQGAVALISGDAPGLGVSFDLEEAAKHPFNTRFLPLARRMDGTIINW